LISHKIILNIYHFNSFKFADDTQAILYGPASSAVQMVERV